MLSHGADGRLFHTAGLDEIYILSSLFGIMRYRWWVYQWQVMVNCAGRLWSLHSSKLNTSNQCNQQRCCKYQSHKYKYKYKCKYLKLTIKYNTSTGTSMSLIKNQTAPALNEHRSVSYYITIYMDFTSLQYFRCYCLFRDKLTVG